MSDTFLNPVTTQTWANGRHIVRCVKVIQETWDVRTFCCLLYTSPSPRDD